MSMSGIRMVHIPYKGSAPAIVDLLAGQVTTMTATMLTALPHVRAGRLRALGITGVKRIAAAQDVPTIAEAGLPGFAATGWFSVVARAGTPRPIIDKLNGVLMPFIKRPDIQDRLQTLAITPLTSTPAELEKFIPAEIQKWAKVVKDAGIEPQ